MTIGIGVIGCGMISRFHARAISELEGANVVACCSSRFESAQTFGKEFSVKSYRLVEELLADPAVDVVSVCTPSGAHLEPALAAARAAKHVVVEKPLEINLDRCDQIIQACEERGVLLSTIFPSRFSSCYQLLKQSIDDHRLGTLTLGDAYVKWFRTQQYYDSGAWRGTWKLDGGGALMNQAIHDVDLLTWLMGPVGQVTAMATTLAHKNIEVEDVATALLRFENNALGVIEATTASYPGWSKRIEISGSKGSVRIEDDQIACWHLASMTDDDKKIADENKKASMTTGGASDPAGIGHAGHLAQYRDIIHAIRSKAKPFIDGHEGRRSVEIIRAIYQSTATGQTVELPLREDPV